MMDTPSEKEHFKAEFNQFKTTTATEKYSIFNARKSEDTNRATRTWVTCFNKYLTD